MLCVRMGAGGGGDLAHDYDGRRQLRGAAEGGGGVPKLPDKHLHSTGTAQSQHSAATATVDSAVTAQSQRRHS